MAGFIILFLLIIGTLYLAFMYYNATIMLLAYLEAALFVVSFFTCLWRRRNLRAELGVPVGIAENGRETLVKLDITNRGRTVVTKVKAVLVVKDILRNKIRKYRMTLPGVLPGKNEFIRSVRLYGTGNYEILLKRLIIYDITGLLFLKFRMKQSGRIQIMPQLHDVPVRLTLATKNFYGESDVYDEHSPGHDTTELFQVREYRFGDRIQNVHWKLTAKQEELMVKEHSLPKSCPVILILDVKSAGGRKKKKLLSFIEAAASLSYSMMDAGCPHYIVWYDGVEKDVVRIRIDDEESLFCFIGLLMKAGFGKTKEDLLERYKERYRTEPYVWALSLNEKLVLKKNGELLTQYTEKNLEKTLSGAEIIL